MEKKDLARKVLDAVKDASFNLSIYADTGWDDKEEFCLDREKTLYLLKERIDDNSLFEGVPVKAIDLDKELDHFAREYAWPDGGPRASVNSIVPLELEDLAEKLEDLDDADPETVDEIREELEDVEGGNYTFSFTVTDAEGDYYFDEDAEEELELTRDEVLGLFYFEYGDCHEELFDGICDEEYGEEDLNEKARKKGFALDYDNVNCGCDREPVECFLDSWTKLIKKILAGDLTDEQFPLWLSYFDPENAEDHEYDFDIEIWTEET